MGLSESMVHVARRHSYLGCPRYELAVCQVRIMSPATPCRKDYLCLISKPIHEKPVCSQIKRPNSASAQKTRFEFRTLTLQTTPSSVLVTMIRLFNLPSPLSQNVLHIWNGSDWNVRQLPEQKSENPDCIVRTKAY